MAHMDELSALLNIRWENAGRYLRASTGLSAAAAAVMILWLAALVQQGELPTLNNQGG